MPRRLTCLIPLVVALLGGCGRGSGGESEPRAPQPSTLTGVYKGELPCGNCAAIEATLWLRPDGRFVLRQHVVDDTSTKSPANEPSTTYGLGRWQWDDIAAEAVLRGAGPDRRLIVRDENRVQLRVPSPVEQVLIRDAAAPRFDDRLTLDGESAVTDHGASFTECLTGLRFAVTDAGAYRELRRQHRRMNPRGKVALTTVEGHLVTTERDSTTSERLVVDRFITMKPGKGC